MSQSLWDHELRLHDLELAVEALCTVLRAEAETASVLQGAVQTLRSRGHKGAADLLIGARATVPYRR